MAENNVGEALKHENPEFVTEEKVFCDNFLCRIKLYDDCIAFHTIDDDDNILERILWEDVLKLKTSVDPATEGFVIHYIKDLGHVPPDEKGIRWTCMERTIDVEKGRTVSKLRDNMEEMFKQKVTCRPKSLLIMVNPKSGNSKGEEIYHKTVKPLMKLVGIKVHQVVMEGKWETMIFFNTYDLSKIDGIVVVGGDGSLADLINCMALRHLLETGIEPHKAGVEVKPVPIKLGIVPAGSGQGSTLILNGSFDAETAVLHIIKGAVIKGDMYTCHFGDRWVYSGMLGGGIGYLADLVDYSDSKRWLGTWRYMLSFFRTLWYLNTFDAEIEILKLNENGNEEWEKMQGKFMEIDVSPGRIGTGTFFHGALELIMQREASRLDTMKYVGKMVKADKSLYQSPHLSVENAKEVRITLPHIKSDDDDDVHVNSPGSVVHFDGEVFQIRDPKITFRHHRHVMNYFGTLRDADAIIHH